MAGYLRILLLCVFVAGCSRRPSQKIDVPLGDGVVLSMVRIAPGRFRMGSPQAEQEKALEATMAVKKDWTAQEMQHEVEITRTYYIGIYEVTQAQYESVMRHNPSFVSSTGAGKARVKGQDTSWFPVDSVSWDDAIEFCKRLSDREGKQFDLPTEAEWEYACRAGSAGAYAFGDTHLVAAGQLFRRGADHGDRGLLRGQRLRPLRHARQRGRVVQGLVRPRLLQPSPRLDPPGPTTGTYRVIRGGCCYNPPAFCRSRRPRLQPPQRTRRLRKGRRLRLPHRPARVIRKRKRRILKATGKFEQITIER